VINNLQAKNQLKFSAILYFIIVMLNIVVSIPLAKIYGGFGTAFVTAITMLIGHIIIMNIYYQERVGIDIVRFWKNIIQLTIPNLCLTLIVFFIIAAININSILKWILYVMIFSIIYTVLRWFTAMNHYE